MICNKVRIENFRNIEKAEVCFSNGVNILLGDNAQGKTNLIEAIYFIAIGKSFRSVHESEIIKFDKEYASLSLDFSDSIRKQNITMHISKQKRRQVEQNKVKIYKMSDIVGQFRAVLFCPEHLSLIKDGPAQRRTFLDIAISQLRPNYLHSLQKYNKILKQRNQLIKNCTKDRKTFDETAEFWSLQLAHEAAVISKYRLWYIGLLNKNIKECFSKMTEDREIVSVEYQPSIKAENFLDVEQSEQTYFKALTSNYEREICSGTTLYGIHKDDIEILLNGKNSRLFASQGQQRSLALALKLSEGEICNDEFSEYPVFLLDDVLSELDDSRRKYLVNKIKDKQVIMSCCEINHDIIQNAKIIKVKNGTYSGLT